MTFCVSRFICWFVSFIHDGLDFKVRLLSQCWLGLFVFFISCNSGSSFFELFWVDGFSSQSMFYVYGRSHSPSKTKMPHVKVQQFLEWASDSSCFAIHLLFCFIYRWWSGIQGVIVFRMLIRLLWLFSFNYCSSFLRFVFGWWVLLFSFGGTT